MVHAVWDLDPEGGAHLIAAIDPLTSPRRGGPRMIDEAEQARVQRIIDDPRSNEQIASDGLLQLVRLGTEADPGTMYGKFRPLVKIVVTKDTLRSGNGAAVIEGNPSPVSADTAKRLVCSGATQELITTEDGGPLDLGRTKRLFNRAQHEALAARDGGCMWPECNRPPSWTEAHHIDQFKRDGGKTNIADGICLCKFHHLLLHNNGWQYQANRERLPADSTADGGLRPDADPAGDEEPDHQATPERGDGLGQGSAQSTPASGRVRPGGPRTGSDAPGDGRAKRGFRREVNRTVYLNRTVANRSTPTADS